MSGSDDLDAVSRRPGLRGSLADGEVSRSWVYWSVAAGLALGLLVLVLAEAWPLPRQSSHMSFADAFNIAWKIALGPPGIVTARIAVDRINLSSREHLHAVEVARSSELDAAQRRVTELSAKASDQLGSDKPTVRIGGLTDLERLGQNNPGMRQTVVDRICSYLQMPFDLPELTQGERGGGPPQARANDEPAAGQDESLAAARQERRVRQTAQRILARHVTWPGDVKVIPDAFWPGISIDLSEATLTDLALRDCRVTDADFRGAVIHGTADFSGAQIAGPLSFAGAVVAGNVDFTGAQIAGPVSFRRVTVSAYAEFTGATILSTCAFSDATVGHADFTSAALHMGADFQRAKILGNALFARTAVIDGDADLRHSQITGEANFRDAKIGKHLLLAGAAVKGGADFSGATVTGGASFRGAKIRETAWFRDAMIGGAADFENATMHAGADFADANIGGPAGFVNTTAYGDLSFQDTTFGRGEYRGVKNIGTVDFTGAQIPHVVLGDGTRTEAANTRLLIVNPDTRQLAIQVPGTAAQA